jgi:hypothetical protein
MNEEHWLCLDCGKNTFHSDDYYMLRNKLWRQIVPREQRHGMLCLSCMANRLGRPLTPSDFLKGNARIDKSDPDEQPMDLPDCGIIDTLNAQHLKAIDSGLIADMTADKTHKVAVLIRKFMETSPNAIPGLPDYFYLLRIEQMVDAGVLRVTNDAGLLIRSGVQLA